MTRATGRILAAALLVLMSGNPGCSCKDGGEAAADLNLFWTPQTIDFGTVAINQSRTILVTLKHVGTSGVITLSDFHVDSGSDEFSLETPADTELSPDEQAVVKVTYSPVDSIDDGGELVIKHNVPPLSETRIPITANGQLADLIAIPNPIDFGDVLAGGSLDKDVVLKNVGSDAVTVNQIYLKPDGSPDFRLTAVVLEDGAVLPVIVKPGEQIGVVLQYQPAGGGEDASLLMVEGDTRGTAATWAYDVWGNELGPHLVAAPGVIDYQWVPLDETRTQLLNVANDGNADLVIESLYVAPGGDANLKVDDAPEAAVTIPVGESRDFHVSWKAADAKPAGVDPIGGIGILSNDSKSPALIPVYGRVDAPFLVVIPDFVDLGFGAQNQKVSRPVTLRNDGHGSLVVSALSIEDVTGGTAGQVEWAFEVDPSFGPGPTWTIEGNGSMPVTVSFTNKGLPQGTSNANLAITSNSPGGNLVKVAMTVARAGSPICKPALVPSSLGFGTVAEGFYKEAVMNLVNNGSGYCSFRGARIADCIGTPFGITQCLDPDTVAGSQTFQFASMPPMTMNGIPPGATVPLRIRFAPKNVASVFGQLTEYQAVAVVKIYDAANKTDTLLPTPQVDLTGAKSYQANLKGTGGIAKVSVLPDEIDFGLVTIGCFSRAQKVCVYNTGSMALDITDIKFEGCTPEFKKKNVPGLPKAVAPNVPFCFELAYAPQDEGPDECTMQIFSNDQSNPNMAVALKGTGTYETHQTDKFQQVSGQEVDILFVIDDSGSMCEEQDRLISNFAQFIQQSTIWNNAYHIGVISVMVEVQNIIGRLNRGNKNITPRYITPSAQAQTQFAKLADLGCDGGSDSQEAALQAAQAALSAPLTSDTGIACSSDDQCANDKSICSSPTGCPYYCIDGTCGGWNKGFLRKDAQLEIVVLSDEEDQSSAAPSFYIDFFKNIKGYYNVNMMHVNTIVGMPANPGDQTCTSPDGSTGAEVGKRYLDVADQTGGKKGSICDPTFATVMNEIGAQAFGLKVQFYLSRLADPPTVTVKVKGAACPAGWTYDAPSNSVIFDDEGACMPQPGDEIVIDYETICLTS